MQCIYISPPGNHAPPLVNVTVFIVYNDKIQLIYKIKCVPLPPAREEHERRGGQEVVSIKCMSLCQSICSCCHVFVDMRRTWAEWVTVAKQHRVDVEVMSHIIVNSITMVFTYSQFNLLLKLVPGLLLWGCPFKEVAKLISLRFCGWLNRNCVEWNK